MSLLNQVQEVVAATLKVPAGKINASTRNEDLPQWDSLGHVNLMLALEQTFGVFLDVEDFPELVSVPAILEYLTKQGVK